MPLSDADRRRVLRDVRTKLSFVPVVLRDDLSWDEMTRIEVNTLELPGVSIEQALTRYYPFGDEISHTVGYVAAVSEDDLHNDDPLLELPDFRIGKSGIEKAYDLDLRGTAGTSEVEVNAFGRVVRELAREEGLPGQDISLSIDMELQDLAVKRCKAQGSASCVVLDAWTGEVLVLASTPGFDPGAFSAGLDADDVATAHRRSAQSFEQQGDQRHLRARLDLQAAGRDGRARERRADREHGILLPRHFHLGQCAVPLLEEGRPWDARR